MSRYNLGCGPHRLDGWINIDIEATVATDRVADLTEVTDIHDASAIVSNAFFEHLPARQARGASAFAEEGAFP